MKLKKRKPETAFRLGDRDIPFSTEDTVLEALLHEGIQMDYSCGGMGSCSTCRVIVDSNLNELPKRTIPEQEIAQDRGFARNERLSCQLHPYVNLKIRIP